MISFRKKSMAFLWRIENYFVSLREKLKDIMKYLLTLASVLLLFSACSSDDTADFTNTKSTRAVMVYMAGENSLTLTNNNRFLNNDLKEIVEGSKYLANDQRLFVFVDSLGTNRNYKGTPYIIEVHGGQIYNRKEFSSDFSSVDPTRFREIISWMTNNIPANGYGLVLWGHATGWIVEPDSIATTGSSPRRAYGLDTNEDLGSENETWLNITQMAQVMKGLPKMDFIFGDCCHMISAETGYELRNVTDYLIGSPAEIPGNGAPYDKMVPQLFKNGSELYRGIIDTYYDHYTEDFKNISKPWKGYSVPLAVIDTRYIAQLAQATRDVLTQFTDGYPNYPTTPSLKGLVFYCGINAPLMYDMRGYIKKYTSESTFRAWDQVYQQAVPYYRMSMRWMTSYNGYLSYNLIYEFENNSFDQDPTLYGCVSMFIPRQMTYYNSGRYRYNTTSKNFSWNQLIDWSRFGW